MKKLLFILFVASSLNGFGQIVRTLNNVSNTADSLKPVSNAMQASLTLKANSANPTFTGTVSGVTATMVGLSNVNNTSDANKPISSAEVTALGLKQNSLSGTGFVRISAGTISYDASTYLASTGNGSGLTGLTGSQITGSIAGNSANVTGTVAVANGGTGTISSTTINGTAITYGLTNTVAAAGSTLTGTALNSPIVTSSLTSVGTIGTGSWQATPINDTYISSSSNWNTAYTRRVQSGLLASRPVAGVAGANYYATDNGNEYYDNGTVWAVVIGAMTGDVTSLANSTATTLSTVNANVGTYGSSTSVPSLTVNAKGLITAAISTAIPIATTSSTGLLSLTDWNTFNGKQNLLGFTPYNATNPSAYIALTALSSTATGLTYTNTTGALSLTAGYVIPTSTQLATYLLSTTASSTYSPIASPIHTGDIETTTIGSGVIVKSPNGTRFRLSVSNTGDIIATSL